MGGPHASGRPAGDCHLAGLGSGRAPLRPRSRVRAQPKRAHGLRDRSCESASPASSKRSRLVGPPPSPSGYGRSRPTCTPRWAGLASGHWACASPVDSPCR
jgi:hypothetical protein